MMRKNLTVGPAKNADKLPHGKRGQALTGLAAAVALSLGLFSMGAQALSLGRVNVLSALGEPLRAEIEVPEINAEEAASLRASVGTPEAFSAAGLEYNPALAGVQITLQKRPDGRSYLRLTSDRPVTDPFIDLVLDTRWSSGRISRDYTMLFDPPNLRQAQPVAPTAPQIIAAPAPRPAASVTAPVATPVPAAPPPAPAAVAVAPTPRAAPAPRPAPAPPAAVAVKPAAAPQPAGDKQVKVNVGDTAGKIAAANKPDSVSLDQMLVAMLRANPDAFIGGNINRMKAGSVLDMPTSEQAAATPAAEASRTVTAQSKDFNEFRRKLAEGAPKAQVAAADRQGGGKLQASVEDKKTATASPDKLTLSKGAVQPTGKEAQIAAGKQAQDASTRVAELSKNIGDLAKLEAASSPVGSAVAASAAKGSSATPASPAAKPAASGAAAVPAVPVATPAVPAPAATIASAAKPAASAAPTMAATPASAPAAVAKPADAAASAAVATATPASAPAATTPAPAPAAPVVAATPASAPAPVTAASAAKPVVQPATPAPESGLLADLMDNPMVPAAAGGLIALLAGLGLYRARQRKKSSQVDSSFLESRLQPDSFFGASGGQRVDTAEAAATGSSMVYSPSQLDAAGDVDPVAEADVYLAYGRDLQAEEILKEAMRTNPTRVAIHGKLLEIYAKRRDIKAFEVVATEAYNLTQGTGFEWEQICGLGRDLDGTNTLYQAGGHPANRVSAAKAMAPGYSGASTLPQSGLPEDDNAVDLDLDLDFSSSQAPLTPSTRSSAPEKTSAFNVAPAVALKPSSFTPSRAVPLAAPMMDFQPATIDVSEPVPLNSRPSALDLSSLDLPPSDEGDSTQAPSDSGMMEFDMGSLSLDLTSPSEQPKLVDGSGADEPLATKLALAEEFRAIGDEDGARALVKEVMAEASGGLKTKAQRLLAELG